MQEIAVYEGNIVEFNKIYIDAKKNLNFEVGDTVVIERIVLNTTGNDKGIKIILLSEEEICDDTVVNYNEYLKRLFKVKRNVSKKRH